METIQARYVVLGAGVVGSAAAYHLARRGKPVLLVDRFEPGHARGSSHGLARITRHSYADEPHARLMIDAFRGWRELEADAARPLYIRTGGVSFSPPGVDYASRVADSLEAIGVPHRRMTGRELGRALPAFAVPEAYEAVFEPDAGLLLAEKIVAAQVELAVRQGAVVRWYCPIRRLDLDDARPVLIGDGLRIVADRLIVAAGAWVGHLLPGLAARLRPTRQQVLYFQPPDATTFAPGRFPVWIYKGKADDDAYYGMPEFLGGGVKAARHAGPETDPDHHDPIVPEEYVERVRNFLRDHVPALAQAPLVRAEVCLYTMAPDELFVVGSYQQRPELLIASPCSGHGFKFANLVGKALADLATLGRTDLDIGLWSPDRASVRD